MDYLESLKWLGKRTDVHQPLSFPRIEGAITVQYVEETNTGESRLSGKEKPEVVTFTFNHMAMSKLEELKKKVLMIFSSKLLLIGRLKSHITWII